MNLTEKDFEEQPDVRKVYLNPIQKRLMLFFPFVRNTTTVVGRGGGKSTAMGYMMKAIAENMPRSKWAIQGKTYAQLENDTLPGTLDALETLGYKERVNLAYCEKPPASWGDLPKAAPKNFERFITLYNPDGCVGFQLLSQDRKSASGRGPSFDGILVDEFLTIDEELFQKQTSPAKRGYKPEFEHLSYYKSTHKFSSMPYGKAASSIAEAGAYYDNDRYNFRAAVNDIIKIEKVFLEEREAKIKLEIWKEILIRKKQLRWYIGPDKQFYHEGDSFDNLHILGLDYIQEAYNTAAIKALFYVEFLNELIGLIEGGFYAGFNPDVHTYAGQFNYSHIDNLEREQRKEKDSRWDEDCIPQLPLSIGLDFGSKLNCAVVAQTLDSINRINILKDFAVTTPKKLFDLADEITHYYRYHAHRVIELYPDAQGNDETIISKQTWTEQFMGALREKGWEVINRSHAMKNPYHHQKHLLINNIFKATEIRHTGNNPGILAPYPDLYINAANCKQLIFVIGNTGSIDEGKGIVGKDKRSEKTLPVHQQKEAAHLGDALDQIVHTRYGGLLSYSGFGTYFLPVYK